MSTDSIGQPVSHETPKDQTQGKPPVETGIDLSQSPTANAGDWGVGNASTEHPERANTHKAQTVAVNVHRRNPPIISLPQEVGNRRRVFKPLRFFRTGPGSVAIVDQPQIDEAIKLLTSVNYLHVHEIERLTARFAELERSSNVFA